MNSRAVIHASLSQKERQDQRVDNLNRFLFYANHVLFPAMQEADHRQYTGNPIITGYSFNVHDLQPSVILSIEIECLFKFTEESSVTTKIDIIDTLMLPNNLFSQSFQQMVTDEYEQTLQEVVISKLVDCFYGKRLLLLLEQAGITEGIHNKENIYVQALRVANKTNERVKVLGCLINALADYNEHIMLMWHEDNNVEKRDKLLNENHEKINKYLSVLPPDCRGFIAESYVIKSTLLETIKHLKELNFKVAWETFSAISHSMNYFVQRTCPDLAAMFYQLSSLFIIIEQKKLVGSDVRIPAHSIITYAKAELESAHHFLCDISQELALGVKNDAILRLESLLNIGEDAKSRTSREVSSSLHSAELNKQHINSSL